MSRQQMGFCALCQCLNQSVTPARSTFPAPRPLPALNPSTCVPCTDIQMGADNAGDLHVSVIARICHTSQPAGPRPGRRAGAWERGGSSFALLWPQRFARMKSLGWGVSRAGGAGCHRGVGGDPKGNKLRAILQPLSPCLGTGRGGWRGSAGLGEGCWCHCRPPAAQDLLLDTPQVSPGLHSVTPRVSPPRCSAPRVSTQVLSLWQGLGAASGAPPASWTHKLTERFGLQGTLDHLVPRCRRQSSVEWLSV